MNNASSGQVARPSISAARGVAQLVPPPSSTTTTTTTTTTAATAPTAPTAATAATAAATAATAAAAPWVSVSSPLSPTERSIAELKREVVNLSMQLEREVKINSSYFFLYLIAYSTFSPKPIID